MTEVIEFLRNNEVILLFLVMGLGYILGHIKIGWFSLGTTAGALIVGLIIGMAKFDVSPLVKSIGFAVFIYAVGLRVGPQFFNGLKKDGLKLTTMSIIGCLTAFGMVWAFSAWLDLGTGVAPGILSGAMTNSPTLGAATQAISKGSVTLPQGMTAQVALSNVAVAYAITYLFGTVGRIIYFKLLPRLFGYDLAAEAKKLEAEMSAGSEDDDPYTEYFSEFAAQGIRGFQLANDKIIGKDIKHLQGHMPDNLVIERVERDGRVLELSDDMALEKGDLIAVSGHTSDLIEGPKVIGPEVVDKALLDITGEKIEILVTNKKAVGMTLGQLGKEAGFGCYLDRFVRSGVEQHTSQGMKLEKGDELFVTGAKTHVDRLAKFLGAAVHRSATTDLLTLSIGLVLGGLLGAVTFKIFGIPVSLGSAGGLLMAGIIISFLRSRHPTFGNIPGGARTILEDVGLTMFIVIVGLDAGSSVIHVLKTSGPAVFLVGVAVTMIPATLTWLWGLYVLKLNPVIAIGACTGAGVITAALKAVNEEAGSALPALGYPVPYAVSTIMLTVMGFLILQMPM